MSLGKLVEEHNYAFEWSRDAGPRLSDASGQRVPLQVRNRVPIISSPMGQALASFLQASSDEFFEEHLTTMFEEFDATLTEGQRKAIAASGAKVASGVPHELLHQPADPACAICMQGKMSKVPARRACVDDSEETTLAKRPGDRVHVDTVGPTKPGIHGETCAQVARDEFCDFLVATPLRDKSAQASWNAFAQAFDADANEVKCIRTDNGSEFKGEFDEQVRKRGIKREFSLPYRPQTNARAECFHRSMANGARCLMLQARMPYVFWTFCIVFWCYTYARLPGTHG